MRRADNLGRRSTKGWVFRLLCCAALLSAPVALSAQQLGLPQGQILTIEPDRLYTDSDFGKRVLHQLEAESAVLAAENRRIEAELTVEEKDLTLRRSEMEPAAFRILADAFDEKVQETRHIQDAKTQELAKLNDANRRVFLQAARPVLEEVMREAGAGVILDRDTTFLSANATDITDFAIERINSVLGDGSQSNDTSSP
ncbi:MAG: OmpH family outer membrane protein [Rhodobacteraceae bacterium]|nr:OmpH family outer membrane protein [Paracoccaceae bacterium]